MSTKRKQYVIRQFSISDIADKDGTFSMSGEGAPVKQSENFLFHMIEKKWSPDSETLKNVISIKTGRNAKKGEKEVLAHILNDGVTLGEKKFVFLDCSLSSSQHKTCKQYYVDETIYHQVVEMMTLGKKPKMGVQGKCLTAVALMTTSCNLFDISDYIDDLDICVIEDLEYDISGNKIVYKADYQRTPEEEKQYQDYLSQLEANKEYHEALASGKQKAKDKEISKRKNGNKDTERTIAQLEREGLRPKMEQADKPVSRFFASAIYKSIPCYTREQCEPIPDEFEFPVNRMTTGIDFVEQVQDVPLNFADGTALMDESFAKLLNMDLKSEGGQLRFPYCKAFFSIVKLHYWLKEKNAASITDIFGETHQSDKVDILMTKSCFKAFLEKGETENKDGCLFNNMTEYKSLIKKYGYDAFGIANYVHGSHSQYTKITYQMLLALRIKPIDMVMFAQDECNMINKAISIYTGNGEANWENVKYLLAFLHMLQDEKKSKEENLTDDDNPEDDTIADESDEINDDSETETAAEDSDEDGEDSIDTNENWEEPVIQAIRLNKNMIFDPYVRKKIYERVVLMVNEMRLGKIYMPCNYHFVTCHIPTLIEWAIHRDVKKTQQIVPRNKAFMGNMQGLYVGMRNPVTSYSEVSEISLEADACKWTNHLRNIIQFGEGLFMPQMNMDYDGDKICLFSTKQNYKQTVISWPVCFKGWMLSVDDDRKEVDTYEHIQELMNARLEKKKPNGKVTFADFIIPSLPQINFADKATTDPADFNKKAVVDFILNADDKTGQITDKTSQAENRMIAEKSVSQYEYAIRYGKYLQGLQIDASKSGLPVFISESFQYTYQKKPLFLLYKCGGREWLYDQDYTSPLDWFAEKILSEYLKWIKEQIYANTKKRKEAQLVYNTTGLLLNPNLDCNIVREFEQKLESDFLEYKNAFKAIHKRYKKIDAFSKNDDAKERRKLKRQAYSELNQKTREKIYQLCPNQSIVAQAAANYAYKYSKENNKEKKELRWQDNWNFAWMFPEGLIYHLWLNQDEEKIDVSHAKSSNYDFTMLDQYYAASTEQRRYEQSEISEISDITVPQEYWLKEPQQKIELKDVLCKGLDAGLTMDDISERFFEGAILSLNLVNGYTQLWDESGKIIGINHYELKQYPGGKVIIQRIFNQTKRTAQIDCTVQK
ncbi:hypothetical protein [Caproiciproducens galactitolivorans]|uniref:Uncharacterized protein n=1 Tax=Caproiciproducens galactitolivorans TaxID=642589 RepID=A0ABT4BUA9_9FIRM|nr:hypothetical protein [Caproiciproducens galactitolivorans]MCY1714487.1 hypothetical protein [Caproiciproducens galactitolivorans]